jgi:4-hydroxybenzoate polyprenyltransferase
MTKVIASLKNLLDRIENMEITFGGWVAAFLGVLFVRIFLENFSNVPFTGNWTSDASTIVHYYLYYLAAALSIILFLSFFVNHRKLERVILFALAGNTLAPIFDLLFSGGKGRYEHYIFADGAGLARNFFAFFTPAAIPGMTPGMRIGILIGGFIMLLYVIYHTNSVLKGVFAAIAIYAISFFWGALPSFWKLIYGFFSPASRGLEVSQFFLESEAASVIPRNFLHPAIQFSYLRGIEVFFNVAMSQIYYILISIIIVAYMFLRYREKFLGIMRNSRQFRAAHYYFIIAAGIFVALKSFPSNISWNWLDITTLTILFLSVFCGRMYVGGVNDIHDVKIDKISNSNRPLPSGLISESDIKNANLFFFIWGFLGGFLAGDYVLFAGIATFFIAHIYSVPPLRLRNYPIIATFLIALASLAAFAAGFYFASPDKTTRALPTAYIALIVLGLTLGENVKDIKDVEGDSAAGAYTIPTIFGEKIGKRIVGVMLAAAFLLVPLLLHWEVMFLPSLAAAALSYLLINRKPYRECDVLLVCSIYAAAALFLFITYGVPA